MGVCTQDRPYLIVLDFADQGDLRHFLIERRPTSAKASQVDYLDMLSYSMQIANGMHFLSTKHKIVHRDLAARNVLVASGKNNIPVMKISDFGLARDVYEEDFYQKTDQGQMAIKWMAPEALIDRIFTTKGDVWSFGIVLWEIASMGGAPYPTHTNYEMTKVLVQEEYRMPPPHNCKTPFHNVMMSCWKEDPKERPVFGDLKATLIDLSGFTNAKLKKILGEGADKKTLARRKTKKSRRNITAGDMYSQPTDPMDPNYEDPDKQPEEGNYLAPSEAGASMKMNARFASVRTKESIDNFSPVTIAGGENMYDAGDDGMYNMASAMAPTDGGDAYDIASEGPPVMAPTDGGDAYDIASEGPPDGSRLGSQRNTKWGDDVLGGTGGTERLRNNSTYHMATALTPQTSVNMLAPVDGGDAYDIASEGPPDIDIGNGNAISYEAPNMASTDGGALYATADNEAEADVEQGVNTPATCHPCR